MSEQKQQRTPLVIASALLAPLLIGLIVTVGWLFVDSRTQAVITARVAWAPLVFGLLLSGLFAAGFAAVVLARRGAVKASAQVRDEQTRRRQRLLARLDHELKNPIQGIRAALADEPSQRQRDSIDAQAVRLSSLLSNLRKISEVEHAELEPSAVNIGALVHEAVQTVLEIPGARERRFQVSLPQAPRPLPHVRGDSDLLFLAVSNVLSNAVKYSPPGAHIEVRGREESGWVVIECADTGRGIAPDEIETVWEELGRSREVRGTVGSGLGLPMVRAIIERHGGTASLQSWYGQGSTVTLRLPAM